MYKDHQCTDLKYSIVANSRSSFTNLRKFWVYDGTCHKRQKNPQQTKTNMSPVNPVPGPWLQRTARHRTISIISLKLHLEKVTELGKLERRIPLRNHRAGGGHKTVHYSSGLGKITAEVKNLFWNTFWLFQTLSEICTSWIVSMLFFLKGKKIV